MNYYLDAEFIEDFTADFTNPYWRIFDGFKIFTPKHYIDLISIGTIAEDGREYYAVNKEFDLRHVWNKYDEYLPDKMEDAPKRVYWLRENVLRPIHTDLFSRISEDMKNTWGHLWAFNYSNLKQLISMFGKTKVQIAQEIQCFTAGGRNVEWASDRTVVTAPMNYKAINSDNPPAFYGYYCDYDWVVFCSLFGRMLDLPKGYPMYMHDLKQDMDVIGFTEEWKDRFVPEDNKHHALADARWNKKLHEALKKHEVWKKSNYPYFH